MKTDRTTLLKLVHGIPAGEELDTDSWVLPSDSGEEWDKAKCSDCLHCPTPLLGEEGPSW